MTKGRSLKIGVIGVGSMGKHHARIFHALPGVNLFAISDINEASVQEIANKYSTQACTDYKEMLAHVDVVSIASPTATHYEVAIDCLNAGKHILVEKPLAKTAEEAEKIVALAKEKNLILAVGFIERFNPVYKELQKLIKKERIIGISIKRFSPFPERITDANVIQDVMIHDLDLLLSLFPKQEIESLKAEGEKIKSNKLDKVKATIYFASGIIATIEADRVFTDKIRKIVVTTERHLIEADLLNRQIYLRDLQTHVPSAHHIKQQDQLTAELLDFIKAVKTGEAPTVDGEAGFKSLKLAEEVENKCS